jgi:multidrug efflux pump
MAAIVLAGLVGFHYLPLSALPEVDYPTIQVQTLYPGASPEVMGTTVTAPLERQLGQMPGLKRMSSTSAAGASVITLQFALTLPLDVAEQEVQAAINASSSLLPVDLPAPPIYAKVNPADAPVLTIAVSSATLPLPQVQNVVETRLAQKISQIGGVGLVSLGGGQRPAVRIQVNAEALANQGVSLDQLRTIIGNSNANGAKGTFDGPTRAYAINANDQLLSVDDYRNMIVAYRNGSPVRLSDVAQIVNAAENLRIAAWANDTPAIIVNVQRQPGANVIATVDAIKEEMPELTADLPASLTVRVLTDRTTGIRASVADVEIELLIAIVLVILVIFLFLHSVEATLIAGLAVPISLIGTFAAMYFLGYSLNNLSLMALTIATGFVVDDAIVMIENIARYLEAGDTPLEAALKGAAQIGFTIISLTVSLIAVLIPLLFMGDVVGRLFREFAVTLAITIVLSAIVSLTLTASLSARWLKRGVKAETALLARWTRGFEHLVRHYATALDWVFEHGRATLLVAGLTFVLTVVLWVLIPKGLFPTQDTGQVQAEVRANETVSFDRMATLQQAVARAILTVPDVASLSSFIGVDGTNAVALNSGKMLINLRPHSDRAGLAVVLERLRAAAAEVAGIELYLQPVQDLTIDAQTGPTQYRLSLEGADPALVSQWTARVVEALGHVRALRDVTSESLDQGLAAEVDIDRDSAARLGISAATVDDALYSAFGQRIISTIFTDTTQYRVILEVKPGLVTDPRQLDQIQVQTSAGRPTPLSSFASVVERSAPLQIDRVAQFPAATVGFDAAPGVSLGEAVASIRSAESELGVPASIKTTFLGAASAFEASLGNELWLILAAVVCVYIVLGVLYESYIHPLTILSTLPSAGVGALLALMLSGNELGVIGIIGIILLIGIVKKNAIMMIDFAIEAERERGLDARSAIREAALLRFRPILMTTFAALFAAVPLMLGFGEGSELRRPLGIAIFGGLIMSQLLTLFTTPIIYLAFDRWVTGARARPAALSGTETSLAS